MRALVLSAASGLALLSACQVIGGFESFERGDPTGAGGSAGSGTGGASGADTGGASGGGSGGTSGGAGAGGGHTGGSGGGLTACPAGSDPGAHGPKMAEWQRPDGTCFWIDETEVTVADYAEFLGAAHAPQTAVCSGNTSYEPACPGGDAGTPLPTRPVTCVDWCDAAAFCAWAGKELCSDTTVQTDFANEKASDWYAVCSSNGKNAYPYGRSESLDACATAGSPNGCPGGACSTADVGSYPTCKVAATNGDVVDLIGNVEEWTAACSPNTASGNCNTRGGFYGTNASCQSGVNRIVRTQASETVGFRCCASAASATDGG